MITVSTSNAAYHHGNLRDALIAAGLAALEGPDGKPPSLRELARNVGVSATAVYRHFPDKQALDLALAQEGLRMLFEAQRHAASTAECGSAAFAQTGRAYVRFALAHPALFRLTFTQGDPVSHRAHADPAWSLLAENSLALTGDRASAERLALQAWAIAHGIAMLMLDGRLPTTDALIDRLLDTASLFPAPPPHGSRSDESP